MILTPASLIRRSCALAWTKVMSNYGPYKYRLTDRIINNKPVIILESYTPPQSTPVILSYSLGAPGPSEEECDEA